jgi:signal transduction histidine kinase
MLATVTRTLRVLQVEDAPDDAELVLIELERAGYKIESRRVATPDEYLEALETEEWDVVLSDFAMPYFSGKAALDILKEQELDIPFIIVSGSLGEEVAVEVMKAGAHDFFAKGNLTRLASAVQREVREAELRHRRLFEQRRAEAERERLLGELQAAVQARDMFLAIASHELKTPLTSLQLHVQGLRRNDALAKMPFDKLETKVDRIARQVTRLTTLVNGLFDVLRITSSKMTLAREEVDLSEVVRDVLAHTHDFLQLSESTVAFHGEPVIGFWDRARIETVVSNLLSNAAKFGEHKPIEVSVSGASGCARLVVADHGIGIAPEAQRRIFHKFERAVPVEHYGGFGLGLWIVRQIIEAHGGGIHIDSRLGEGSTFTVELPRQGARA